MIDLTPFVTAIIGVLAAIALRYAIPWLREKTTAQERENMLAWVDIAVMAAQQLYHHLDGKDRLEYALELLENKGFDINDTAILDAVEAAVLKLHQGLVKSDDR